MTSAFVRLECKTLLTLSFFILDAPFSNNGGRECCETSASIFFPSYEYLIQWHSCPKGFCGFSLTSLHSSTTLSTLSSSYLYLLMIVKLKRRSLFFLVLYIARNFFPLGSLTRLAEGTFTLTMFYFVFES